MKTKGKRKKIGTTISLVTGVLLVLSIVFILLLCVLRFQALLTKMLENQCVSGTNLLAFELSEYTGERAEATALLDALKAQTGYEYTIFEGDERVATTIVQNGNRAVGTKLSAELSELVLKQGKTYIGETDILGVAHICSYVPTRDENGAIDGLIFSGVVSEDAMSSMRRTVIGIGVVSAVFIVSVLLFIYFYMKRNISVPLQQLTAFARTVEKGNLGLTSGEPRKAGITSRDEIGRLARAFEVTIQRLQDYIGELSRVLNAIANNDLTAVPSLEYVGDFSSIKSALQEITARLNQTLCQVVVSSEQVAGSANQVSVGAQSLSRGAAEQAAHVEGLVTTLCEVNAQIAETADSARAANERSEETEQELASGKERMEQMTAAMQRIDEASTEINKVIKVIEDIAFQTNILALNAAVEATRAGEAGKGFAVVAEEVRSLAGKSAEASKNTTQLIENSIAAVRQGTEIAAKTAQSLDKIVLSSEETAEMIQRISVASQAQARHLEKVMQGMEQISSIVQETSSTAEESAASSEELSGQADILRELVERFQLRESMGA